MPELININPKKLTPLRQLEPASGNLEWTEIDDQNTYDNVPHTLKMLGQNAISESSHTFGQSANQFAVQMWSCLMGNTVYDLNQPNPEWNAVFCHSRKDGKDGYVYLIINESNEMIYVNVPTDATRYTLSGGGKRNNRILLLNGRELKPETFDAPTKILGAYQNAGTLKLIPGTSTFLVL